MPYEVGTLKWDLPPSYDHTLYMRLWRQRRRGALPVVDPSGETHGYIIQRPGFIELYTVSGRRWKG